MLRLLAVFAYFAPSNGLRMQVKQPELVKNPINNPWMSDKVTVHNMHGEELVLSRDDADRTIVKKGDGENIPKDGDVLTLKMKGLLKNSDFHDMKYHESFYQFKHPYQESELTPFEKWTQNSMSRGVDVEALMLFASQSLSEMSLGEISNFRVSADDGGSADFDVELLQINDKLRQGSVWETVKDDLGNSELKTFEEDKQFLSAAHTYTKQYSGQLGMVGFNVATVEAGDGQTFVRKGDKITLRMWGVSKANHFNDATYSSTVSWQYPVQEWPIQMGFVTMDHGWDEEVVADMSLNEIRLMDAPMPNAPENKFFVQLVKIDPASARA